MEFLLSFIFFIFIIICIYINKSKRNYNFIGRFKFNLKSRNHLRKKLYESFSDHLLLDPEKNIEMGIWQKEFELREKADIHRARLNKYGKSKMNGEMIFLGPKGGVYKINSDGNKKYL